MAKFTIKFIGLPKNAVNRNSVEIELNEGADLCEIIAELKREIPTMDGTIFIPGENKLMKYYIFNINGRIHYTNDHKIDLKNSDRIILMILPTGG